MISAPPPRVLVLGGSGRLGRAMSALQDGWTLEVNRLCTDGTDNAPSKLYQAAWCAARALGWRRLVTYNLKPEGGGRGGSLLAAGWRVVAEVKPERGWSRKGRPRVELDPYQERLRWEPVCPECRGRWVHGVEGCPSCRPADGT